MLPCFLDVFQTSLTTMWNFGWSPQPMGLQGQFCGGDMMNQQSQAQSQAQTQAQLAALREQIRSSTNSSLHKLSPISNIFNNSLLSPSIHSTAPYHLHPTGSTVNTSSVRTTYTYGYLHPHKLDPVHPSILKR